MAGGRPSKLTEELIADIEKLCARGLPDSMVRAVADVSDRTWRRWLEDAETAEPDSLLYRFRRATQSGVAKVNNRYLGYLHEQAENGNVNAITWYLTHHPKLREVWSDAAATRREVQATLQAVVQAIQASDLTPEQQDHLLLRMQAAGLGTPAG